MWRQPLAVLSERHRRLLAAKEAGHVELEAVLHFNPDPAYYEGCAAVSHSPQREWTLADADDTVNAATTAGNAILNAVAPWAVS
jgi:hypothetical protein